MTTPHTGQSSQQAERRFSAQLKHWRSRLALTLTPSRAAWRGATAGALVVPLVVWLSVAVDAMSDTIAGPLLVCTGITLATVLAAGLLLLALRAFRLAPLYFRWVFLAGTALFVFSFLELPIGRVWILSAGVIAATLAAMAGGAVGVLLSGQWRRSGVFGRVCTAICGVVGIGSLVAAGVWLAGDGPPREEIPSAAAIVKLAPRPTSLADPSRLGMHEVKTLTYGSGTDLQRPEFAAGATLRTDPVDGSKVLKGWDGATGWARTRFFGFDAEELPLNGRVWYPDGDGPFPLVLVVHGNHHAAEFSDPGYEYLGRLLASRGYIVASIDENFLNGMATDIEWGLESENNARAWLLLEHLRVWHGWTADKDSPFYRRVDTRRIALVGHSRGGEAVAHAALFNRLPYYPDNAMVRFDYAYEIKSIVAIAPADGQYRPAGTLARLSDINYFTLQGAHDSDVSSFLGLHQYDRVTFTGDGDWFKSAVYVYGANHGQFNTEWGAFDVGVGISERLLSTAALLNAADQRRILEVYVSAFLDCTLRGVADYRGLFQDWRYGSGWLPETVYLNQYADSTMMSLCTFDEDVDLTTATVDGGTTRGEGLTLWREGRLALRAAPNDDRSVVIGWDRDIQEGVPSYEITWPPGAFELGNDSVLSFCLADGNEDPTPDENETSEEQAILDEGQREAIDLTIEITDTQDHAARLPLSHFSALQPQMDTLYWKSAMLHRDALSEPVPQTFLFPLKDFRASSADFDPATAVKLRLVFDRTESGVVIFDKAAFGSGR